MKPIEKGQIVKFHTPNIDEDPNQKYVVLEVFEDGDRTRAKIEALDTGFIFPSVNVVLARDLEVEIISSEKLSIYIEAIKKLI